MAYPSLVTNKSKGKSGKHLIKKLESLGFGVGGFARDIILSDEFIPTKGRSYTLEARPTTTAGKFSDWTPVEAAVLLRMKLSDRQIAELRATVLLVMHKPVICRDGFPYILGLCRDGGGKRLVGFCTEGSLCGVPHDRAYLYRIG